MSIYNIFTLVVFEIISKIYVLIYVPELVMTINRVEHSLLGKNSYLFYKIIIPITNYEANE